MPLSPDSPDPKLRDQDELLKKNLNLHLVFINHDYLCTVKKSYYEHTTYSTN